MREDRGNSVFTVCERGHTGRLPDCLSVTHPQLRTTELLRTHSPIVWNHRADSMVEPSGAGQVMADDL